MTRAGVSVFLAVISISWFWLLGAYSIPLWLKVCIATVSVVVGAISSSTFVFAVGFSVCALPFLGHGSLGFVLSHAVLGMLIRRIYRSQCSLGVWQGLLRPWTIVIFIYSLSALYTVSKDYDGLLVASTFAAGGFEGISFLLSHQSMSWVAAIHLTLGWLLAAFIFFEFRDLKLDRAKPMFYLGLSFGALVSSVYAVGQILQIHPLFELSYGIFWARVGRFSGSFSDPNAFGIMGALVGPYLLAVAYELWTGARRGRGLFVLLAAVSLLIVSLWSGSRTFWLGLLFWGLFLLGRAKLSRGICLSLLVLFASGLLGAPALNEAIRKSVPLPGVERVLKTLHWQEASSMFNSRIVFTKIALSMSGENLVSGVGLGRFKNEMGGYSKSLGLELENWWDNANNWYLHLLAEFGLSGVTVLLLSLVIFFWKTRKRERPQKTVVNQEHAALFIFLVLSLTGPHVHFEEIRYLMVGFLGLSVLGYEGRIDNESWSGWRKQIVSLVTIVFVSLFLFGLFSRPYERRSFGVFPLERQGEERTAWTGAISEIAICRTPDVIEFRSLAPAIASDPHRVELEIDGVADWAPVVEVRDGGWRSVRFPALDIAAQNTLKVRVSRAWRPSDSSQNPDSRWLGVQLKWPAWACG